MSKAGFESAIPQSDRPQTLALDRLATNLLTYGRYISYILFPVYSERFAYRHVCNYRLTNYVTRTASRQHCDTRHLCTNCTRLASILC